ncbi:hypothetical protein B7939_00505 [Eggerthia catenaformis]|nr:hypothetical protein B7939_00505 [Eggerthia catenaformis]
MISQILEKLKEITDVCVYGIVLPSDVENKRWEFIAIRRNGLLFKNGSVYQKYLVVYCDEEYIAEGKELEIIQKMKELHISKDETFSISYDVMRKGSTDERIEMVAIGFLKKIGHDCNG